MYLFDKKNHLHIYEGKPLTGTSSVGDVLFKPLHWWASGKAVETLGWSHPKKTDKTEREKKAQEVLDQIKNITLGGYLKLLDQAYKAHNEVKKEAADQGTDLHDILERWIKSQMGKGTEITKEEQELIQPFIDWSEENIKEYIWSEANCYDEELWIGGISDAGALMKDGKLAVIDFKSSKEVYTTQIIQCAGYAIQIEKNGLFSEDGRFSKNIEPPIEALIVVPFGAEKITPKVVYEVDEYKKGFRSAVQLYRLMGLSKNK